MTDVKVSREERLLYSDLAPVVRLMGRAAVDLEQALEEIGDRLKEAREADAISAGLSDPPEIPTPHYLFIERIYERVYALSKEASDRHRAVAGDVGGQYRSWREGIDSTPAGDPPEVRASEVGAGQLVHDRQGVHLEDLSEATLVNAMVYEGQPAESMLVIVARDLEHRARRIVGSSDVQGDPPGALMFAGAGVAVNEAYEPGTWAIGRKEPGIKIGSVRAGEQYGVISGT